MKPQGFFVGPKAWKNVPKMDKGHYEDNPPDAWEDCEQCGGVHPPGFTGDCRDDINRWPSPVAIAAMESGS